jgi:hypothetical protein
MSVISRHSNGDATVPVNGPGTRHGSPLDRNPDQCEPLQMPVVYTKLV